MSLKPLNPRGIKVTAPKIRLREGRMTSVLEELRREYDSFKPYKRVTEIPDKLLKKYVTALVKKYGYASAKRMILIQIIFRKNSRDPDIIKDRKKFEKMLELVDQVGKI